MKKVKAGGFILFKMPLFLSAQISSDRYGFRKEFHHGFIMHEKNYGDTSIGFVISGIVIGTVSRKSSG
jgi:hypothetical protein